MLDKLSLILVIVGAINWGLVGLFQVDIISMAFGGTGSAFSRILYTLVAIAGLWCISLLFRDKEVREVRD